MKSAMEILSEVYECSSETEELQLSITLNPSLSFITEAMELYGKEQYNKAILKAAEVVQEPYLKSGMTNLTNRAKQSILNLIKK